jgi:molybdopterin converting factor small subunit
VSISVLLGAPVLQAASGGIDTMQIDGATTLNEVLEHLVCRFPNIKQHLYDDKGNLSNTYGIYVNGSTDDLVDLSVEIRDGDEVAITMFFCFPRSGL